jgi:iron-sulfur cluster repair protein YtfE (RIC family)
VAALSSAREADRAALDDIRVFTRDFSLPAGACLEWRALNTTLRNLDVDLFNQAHVEDRYLFPRAPVG